MATIKVISSSNPDPFAYKEVDEKQKRFQDAEWFDAAQKAVVSVGGAGGIGSWLTLFLTRAGVSVKLHDFDTVEEVNLAGQFYMESQCGKAKTSAVKELVKLFGAVGSVDELGKMNETAEVQDICFSGFDNMKARKQMFEAWRKRESRKVFIDGRMSAEVYHVFCVTQFNEHMYLHDTPDDAEVQNEPCTYKSTSHTAAACASDMFSVLTNYLANEHTGIDARNTPYHIKKANAIMHIISYVPETEKAVQSV